MFSEALDECESLTEAEDPGHVAAEGAGGPPGRRALPRRRRHLLRHPRGSRGSPTPPETPVKVGALF